jgi:hypothetical protein
MEFGSIASPTSRGDRSQARLTLATAAMALALLGVGRGRCHADMVITFQSSTVSQGGTGYLEVDLTNTSTTTGVQISGFQLELSQPSGTGLTFTSATTGTTAYAYIFAGNSADDAYLGGSLLPTTTATTIAGSDTVNLPDTFATVAAGQTVGLALFSFSADTTAALGPVPITVVPFRFSGSTDGTLLAEYPSLDSLSFTADAGSIVVTAASVPEPSSLWLGAVGGLFVLAVASTRRAFAAVC